jgi:hypothetical protein
MRSGKSLCKIATIAKPSPSIPARARLIVNGGDKTGYAAAQNQAGGRGWSAMALLNNSDCRGFTL